MGARDVLRRATRSLYAGALLILSALAMRRLGLGFRALLVGEGGFDPTEPNAAVSPFNPIDLALRYNEVAAWFAGGAVYSSVYANYPPATMVILYPLLGPVPFEVARWTFAIMAMGLVVWIGRTFWTACGLGLAPLCVAAALAGNSLGTTIALGQLGLISLAAGMAATLIQLRHPGNAMWPLAGFLLAISLVKPHVGLPFLVLCAAAVSGGRVLVLASTCYALLTALACAFQSSSVIDVIAAWLSNALSWSEPATASYGSVTSWLSGRVSRELVAAASVSTLVMFFAAARMLRASDSWVLIGITSIVARTWAWHRGYDDIIVIGAFPGLCRIGMDGHQPRWWRTLALVVFGLIVTTYVLPFRFGSHGAFSVVWLACLAFFLAHAAKARHSEADPAPTRQDRP